VPTICQTIHTTASSVAAFIKLKNIDCLGTYTTLLLDYTWMGLRHQTNRRTPSQWSMLLYTTIVHQSGKKKKNRGGVGIMELMVIVIYFE
jgi:hypothetical protein